MDPPGNPAVDNLNFTEIEKDVFKFVNLVCAGSQHAKAAYGCLLTTQCLVAADQTVPPSLKSYAVQVMYVNAAVTTSSVECYVRRIFDGRSFATRMVEQKQDGKTTLVTQISYHSEEADSCVHQSSMPSVKHPHECPKIDLDHLSDPYMNGKISLDPVRPEEFKPPMFRHFPYTSRFVDLPAFLGQDPRPQPAPHYVWLKYKFPLDQANDALHRQMFLFISDVGHLITVFRPHMKNDFAYSLMFSLNHSVHFHVPRINMNEYILAEFESTKSKNGRSYTRARYWSQSGEMIGTVCQESIVRTRGPVSTL